MFTVCSPSRTVARVTAHERAPNPAQSLRDRDAVAAALAALSRGSPNDAWNLLAEREFEELHGPDLAQALSARGIAGLAISRVDAATEDLESCVALTPDDPRAWINLSIAMGKAMRYAEAVGPAARAASLAPDDHPAVHNHAVALEHANRLGDAIAAFERACSLAPRDSKSREGLAVALEHTGRFADAEASYRRACELDPANHSARMKLGMLRLLAHGPSTGYDGWADYEARIPWMEKLGVLRRFAAPRWTPDAPPNARVVVYGEQGLGDALQFARFLPDLRSRCSRLILTAKPEVAPLMANLPGVDEIIPEADGGLDHGSLPSHDFWIPLLSVPYQLGLLSTLSPAPSPIFTADPARRAAWQSRLAPHHGLKVGLVWAGSPIHHNDHNRSIDLRRLEPLARVPGVSWISLQKGAGAARDRGPTWPSVLHDQTSNIRDMADTAAVIANLDLVIAVDTSVCHLAGAMGKPVWTLLPWVPDWRWGLTGTSTPWYATMKLWRQPAMNDWESVAAALAAELRTLTATGGGL